MVRDQESLGVLELEFRAKPFTSLIREQAQQRRNVPNSQIAWNCKLDSHHKAK